MFRSRVTKKHVLKQKTNISQFEKELSTLTKNKKQWNKHTTHSFHFEGKKKPFAQINPNPTRAQPGNGLVSYRGRYPKYRDIRFSLPTKKGKINEKKILSKMSKACQRNAVLYTMEIARRAPKQSRKFLSPPEIRRATNRAAKKKNLSKVPLMFHGSPKNRKIAAKCLSQ